MAGYVILLFFLKPFNIIGIGLVFHLFTDLVECLFSFNHCQICLADSPIYPVLIAISNFMGLN
ncbi:hypothetical protein [uncultured Sunxiuqinia sp.]|uniref:hypothetical protein n=1 Tax=uncultured Sunxiuqinia sp. TaxID=1573825 RepID=UPI003747CFD0